MAAVQDPVIPIVGELVRDHPGTISLGQGVVYYGPPDSVYRGIEEFRADLQNNKYKLVQGIPGLLDAIRVKLAAEERHREATPGSASWSRPGATWAS